MENGRNYFLKIPKLFFDLANLMCNHVGNFPCKLADAIEFFKAFVFIQFLIQTLIMDDLPCVYFS